MKGTFSPALRRVSLIALLTAGGLWLGCDAGSDEEARLNKPIGNTLPTSRQPIDLGILRDQSAYQPPVIEGAAPAAEGEAAAADVSTDTPEAAEVRAALDGVLSAFVAVDVDEILNAFDPPAVAALREGEFVQSAKDLVAAGSRLMEVARAKDPGSAGTNEAAWALVPLGKKILVGAFEIAPAGEEATLRLTQDGLKASIERSRAEIVAGVDSVLSQIPEAGKEQIKAQLGGADLPTGEQAYEQALAALTPGEGESPDDPIELPMKKVEGSWRLAVPFALTGDHADALTQALTQATPMFTDLTAQLENSGEVTPEQVQELMQGWVNQNQFQFIAIFGQLAAAFGDLAGPASEPGDAGEAGDASGDAPGETGAAQPTESGAGDSNGAPSLATQVQPIFSSRCGTCHKPLTPAWQNTKLDLRDGKVIPGMVNQPSEQDGSLILIVPGDPDASYVMQKLTSESPTFGRQMPPQDGPLSPDEIDIIRRWIAAGAPDN